MARSVILPNYSLRLFLFLIVSFHLPRPRQTVVGWAPDPRCPPRAKEGPLTHPLRPRGHQSRPPPPPRGGAPHHHCRRPRPAAAAGGDGRGVPVCRHAGLGGAGPVLDPLGVARGACGDGGHPCVRVGVGPDTSEVGSDHPPGCLIEPQKGGL